MVKLLVFILNVQTLADTIELTRLILMTRKFTILVIQQFHYILNVWLYFFAEVYYYFAVYVVFVHFLKLTLYWFYLLINFFSVVSFRFPIRITFLYFQMAFMSGIFDECWLLCREWRSEFLIFVVVFRWDQHQILNLFKNFILLHVS